MLPVFPVMQVKKNKKNQRNVVDRAQANGSQLNAAYKINPVVREQFMKGFEAVLNDYKEKMNKLCFYFRFLNPLQKIKV